MLTTAVGDPTIEARVMIHTNQEAMAVTVPIKRTQPPDGAADTAGEAPIGVTARMATRTAALIEGINRRCSDLVVLQSDERGPYQEWFGLFFLSNRSPQGSLPF